MTPQNLNTILNKFKLTPNQANYELASLALLFYKVRWTAFCDQRTPTFKEAKPSMLPFTLKHSDPNSKYSLLVVAGEETYQLAPGAEMVITLENENQRITLMRCIHTPGDSEVITHEYESDETDGDTAPYTGAPGETEVN